MGKEKILCDERESIVIEQTLEPVPALTTVLDAGIGK